MSFWEFFESGPLGEMYQPVNRGLADGLQCSLTQAESLGTACREKWWGSGGGGEFANLEVILVIMKTSYKGASIVV